MSEPAHLKSDRLILVGPVMKQKLSADSLSHLGLSLLPQIAVDGGDQFAFAPELLMGDGDSSLINPKPANWITKTSIDETDLGFCLNFLTSHTKTASWRELHLFGFLGMRRDHEYAVIGELAQALKKRPHRSVASLYHEELGLEFSMHSPGEHEFEYQGLFSVLPAEQSRMSMKGQCVYPLKDHELMPFSGHGISNEGKGVFTIQSSGVFLMIPGRANE